MPKKPLSEVEHENALKEGMNLIRKGLRIIDNLEDVEGWNSSSFQSWFHELLMVNQRRKQFGWGYPMGTAAYRDVLRDRTVKEAIMDAWERIIVGGETGHERG